MYTPVHPVVQGLQIFQFVEIITNNTLFNNNNSHIGMVIKSEYVISLKFIFSL